MPVKTAPSDVTLLVVDDKPDNLKTISRSLRKAGYGVEQASSAKEALAVIEKGTVDLVLLDNMMPGISGLDLLKLLRATHSPSELPVIMVTALDASEHIVEALDLGANDYIAKPVDIPVALARVHTQLERKRAEEALRESEERYALTARGANDGLWDWDLRSGEIVYSARWKTMLGYEDQEIGHSPEEWLSRIHRNDIVAFRGQLRGNRENPVVIEFAHEYRIRHKDGLYHWMLCRAFILRSRDGIALRMAGSQTDITSSKAFDPLTGLPNRMMFNDRLEVAIERSRENPAFEFALLYLDLDRFKLVNDSLGHPLGDQLLVGVAQRLLSSVRSRDGSVVSPRSLDTVARLGGDEFAVLLEGLPKGVGARDIAERLQSEIRKPFSLEGTQVSTTASIGIVRGSGASSAEGLNRDGDTAMYRAKALGRARSEEFDDSMRADAVTRLELESDLQRAVENGQFVVYYQPKFRLESGRLAGFEALVRWQHPHRGLLPPGQFIHIAEDSGLIIPIGLWVLEEACREVSRWQHRYPASPPLDISVNLSARQFRQADLVEDVRRILRKSMLAPRSLQLEVTESLLIEDSAKARDILLALKDLGVGLQIDDFGTGFSSLRQLTELPFDGLKIDSSFVMKLGSDETCYHVIRATTSLAHSLGLEVVAEGVERQEQLDELRKLGCTLVQGYLLGGPAPHDEVELRLSKGDGDGAGWAGKPEPPHPVSELTAPGT